MSPVRHALRPLVGPRVGPITVILGERRDHTPVVSLSPSRPSRSGVIPLDDPDVLRALILDLRTALLYLEDGR